MLGLPLATPYDLRFRLLGIPVSVNPFFWVVAALLGFPYLHLEPGGPANLITYVLCVFVSLIIHEFGHALTARAFGNDPSVVLYHFGGLAFYRGRDTPKRSFLITAAGPGAQLLFYTLLLAAGTALIGSRFDWPDLLSPAYHLNQELAGDLVRADRVTFGTPAFMAAYALLRINLYWALFNLIPVLPLDGGRLLESGLAILGVEDATEWALKVGVVCGVAVAAYFLLVEQAVLAGMMFAFFAVESFQRLREMRHGSYGSW